MKFFDTVELDITDMNKVCGVDHWSAAVEVRVETYQTDGTVRLHLHYVGDKADRFNFWGGHRSPLFVLQRLQIAASHLKGCLDPTSNKKSKSSAALHYYLQMPKVGGLISWTNFQAYKHFLVNARWIAGFVQRGKMTFPNAEKVLVFRTIFWLGTPLGGISSINRLHAAFYTKM